MTVTDIGLRTGHVPRWRIGDNVPWNAAWSGEQQYEIRCCRYAGGRRALCSPHRPGEGKPIFAKPHMTRQRRSIAEMICSVCGRETPLNDRWWFRLGQIVEGKWFATTESPVHRVCAEHALEVCPHLRGREADLEPLPVGFSVLYGLIGGSVSERDFGVRFPLEGVVGSLKLAWPLSGVRA